MESRLQPCSGALGPDDRPGSDSTSQCCPALPASGWRTLSGIAFLVAGIRGSLTWAGCGHCAVHLHGLFYVADCSRCWHSHCLRQLVRTFVGCAGSAPALASWATCRWLYTAITAPLF